MIKFYLSKIKNRLSRLKYKKKYGLADMATEEISDAQFLARLSMPDKEAVFRHFKEKASGRLFWPGSDTGLIRQAMKALGCGEQAIKKADTVCRHEFSVLHKGPVSFPGRIEWSSDFNGRIWQKGHYKWLNSVLYLNNFNNPYYIGDVKIPWEFNKHLHLFDLAMAYCLSEDEKYAKEFKDQILQWIGDNPYPYNIGWTQPLIASHRAISWIFSLRFLMNSPQIDADFLFKFLKCIYYHLVFIQNHYEIGEKASNHLLGDLAGAILISSVIPEFDISYDILEKAISILSNEVTKQVYPDGVDYEQSVSYQRYIIEFFYVIYFASVYGNTVLPRPFKGVLENMLNYLMNIITPSGQANLIGDADGAYVYKFDELDINDYRPHFGIAGWLYKRPDFLNMAAGQLESLLWIAGPAAYSEAKKIAAQYPGYGSSFFPDGGYGILRSGWQHGGIHATFDCGNIGMGFTDDEIHGTHGHDDMLSITLSAFGKKLLVDPGSGTYTENKRIHDYMRSSLAHNTVSLGKAGTDDIESHSIVGPFWCLSQRPSPSDISHNFNNKTADFVSASCLAYKRFGITRFFTRTIIFVKDAAYFLVHDRFEGDGRFNCLYPFHFDPDGDVEKSSKDGFIYKNGDTRLAGRLLLPSGMEDVRLYKGSNDPYRGWYARDFGLICRSPLLEYRGVMQMPCSGCFLLYPYNGAPSHEFNLGLNKEQIEICYGNRIDVYHTGLSQFSRIEGGQLTEKIDFRGTGAV